MHGDQYDSECYSSSVSLGRYLLVVSAANVGGGCCREDQEEEGPDRSARQALAAAGFDAAFAQALDAFHSLTVANCDAPLMLCCVMLSSLESLPAEVLPRTSSRCTEPSVHCFGTSPHDL